MSLGCKYSNRRNLTTQFDALSNQVIGLAIEVYRNLGPGLLESAYETCLAHELSLAGLEVARQQERQIQYKGLQLDCRYRIDLLVAGTLLLELKSVEKLLPIHQAQLLTHMKFCRCTTGLLINFNEQYLKDGIKRMVL